MELTEEQIQAIIEDTANKVAGIVDNPCGGDYSEFQCYEDECGHVYPNGSYSEDSEIEEICYDGLPGIDPMESDIFITAKYSMELSFHDDYDPGDYLTPPAGGIEIDDIDVRIYDMVFEIDVLNHDTDEYESIEISKEIKDRIINEVNKRVGVAEAA